MINTNNRNVEKLQHDVYELTQKPTLYRDLHNKLTPLIEHLKLLQDSHDQFTKHLTSSFHEQKPFLTDAQQLLDL